MDTNETIIFENYRVQLYITPDSTDQNGAQMNKFFYSRNICSVQKLLQTEALCCEHLMSKTLYIKQLQLQSDTK